MGKQVVSGLNNMVKGMRGLFSDDFWNTKNTWKLAIANGTAKAIIKSWSRMVS